MENARLASHFLFYAGDGSNNKTVAGLSFKLKPMHKVKSMTLLPSQKHLLQSISETKRQSQTACDAWA
jgi:hypothetical protein